MNMKIETEITTGFTFAGPDRMQHLNKAAWTAVQGGRPNPTTTIQHKTSTSRSTKTELNERIALQIGNFT
jgi:hypothetical protein